MICKDKIRDNKQLYGNVCKEPRPLRNKIAVNTESDRNTPFSAHFPPV